MRSFLPRDIQRAKWQEEKGVLEEIQKKKSLMEELRVAAAEAERRGDYGRVAEIRYGKMGELQKEIEGLKKRKESFPQSLINEAVTEEDIAEVVARWTGIPVQRMLTAERDKLLHLEEELHKRVGVRRSHRSGVRSGAQNRRLAEERKPKVVPVP